MASLAGGRGGQSEPYMPSGVRSSGTAVLARTPRVAHTEDACSISFASAQHFRFDVESRPSNAGSRCRSLGTRCHDRARDFLTLGSLDSLQPERSNRSPSSKLSPHARTHELAAPSFLCASRRPCWYSCNKIAPHVQRELVRARQRLPFTAPTRLGTEATHTSIHTSAHDHGTGARQVARSRHRDSLTPSGSACMCSDLKPYCRGVARMTIRAARGPSSLLRKLHVYLPERLPDTVAVTLIKPVSAPTPVI